MSHVNLPAKFRALLNEYADGFWPTDVKRIAGGWDLMWNDQIAARVDSSGKVCYVNNIPLTFFLDEFMKSVYYERCTKTYSKIKVDDIDSDKYKYI